MRRIIIISFVLGLILTNSSNAQIDRSGFNIGLGFGTGFSVHAAAFEEVVDTTFNLIKDYGGYRILLADSELAGGLVGVFPSYTRQNTHHQIVPYHPINLFIRVPLFQFHLLPKET